MHFFKVFFFVVLVSSMMMGAKAEPGFDFGLGKIVRVFINEYYLLKLLTCHVGK